MNLVELLRNNLVTFGITLPLDPAKVKNCICPLCMILLYKNHFINELPVRLQLPDNNYYRCCVCNYPMGDYWLHNIEYETYARKHWYYLLSTLKCPVIDLDTHMVHYDIKHYLENIGEENVLNFLQND